MGGIAENLGRAFGAPKREGSKLFGRPIPDGELGGAREAGPGSREPFVDGEAGRATLSAGEGARIVDGEAERASFDPAAGIPPMREEVDGERGLGALAFACKRVI